MVRKLPALAPRMVAIGKLLQGGTIVPQDLVATVLRVSPTRFKILIREWDLHRPKGNRGRAGLSVPHEDWRVRRQRVARIRPVASPWVPGPADGPIDRLETGRAMERFIAGRIAAYELAARAGRDSDPERTARTIGIYARALSLVRDYLIEIRKDQDDAGPRPRSLAELRDELCRHLERLRERGRADGLDRSPGADGAGSRTDDEALAS